MSSHLQSFLNGGYCASAVEAQQAKDGLYSELLALPEVSRDFCTAEGAILCLEDACRRRDIEAAVAAKDFETEAHLLLSKTRFRDFIDDEAVAQTRKGIGTVISSPYDSALA